MTPTDDLLIRECTDADGDALRSVLDQVFREYPGCLFVREELPELEQPHTWFRAHGGIFWVVVHKGIVQGCVGTTPETEALWELKKLYLLPPLRGRRLGRQLIDRVENHVRTHNGHTVHLWSDTRFVTAHAVYERCGYERLPETRDLNDASASVEFHFRRALST